MGVNVRNLVLLLVVIIIVLGATGGDESAAAVGNAIGQTFHTLKVAWDAAVDSN